MTPTPLAYRDTPSGRMIELSEGTGFDHEPIFGVSVSDRGGTYQADPVSRLFRDRAEARAYMEGLE
jgi:hypothetical protein